MFYIIKQNFPFLIQALPIVQDLAKRNVMPVICGGTNYYIESLLWNVLVSAKGHDDDDTQTTLEPVNKKSKIQADEDLLSNEELHSKLKSVDPERAKDLHPNDRRKILRSLQVFKQEGKLHSEILQDQKKDGGILGGGLRFPMSQLAILWVQCDQGVLEERCDKRVDKMLSAGLLAEMQDFHKNVNEQRGAPDYTVGIFQSIGFKEFHNYLMLSPEEQEGPEGQRMFQEGKEQMMLATRQYARKQKKWIRQRFLRGIDRECPPVYGFDASQPSLWDSKVFQPAVDLIQTWMDGGDLSPFTAVPPNERAYSYEESRQMFFCDVCDMHIKGRLSFDDHLKSRKHQKRKKKLLQIPKTSLSLDT